MSSRMSSPPLFSLVVPLYDDRGVGLQAIQAWLGQRTASTPFELIVADAGRSRLARKVANLIGPGDQILSAKSSNEAYLSNLGARAAISDWLVFSESHVLPTANAVANLCRQLKSTTCDAANLGSIHRTRSHLARIDAELFERENSALRSLGLWRTVGLRGFLIRRSLFHALGMFNESYNRFAETALAIRLVENGYELQDFSDVVLEHCDTDSISELLFAMASDRLGAHRFWACEPKLATAYFKSPSPSAMPNFIEHRLAQWLWYQVLRAIAGGKPRAAGRLLRLAKPTALAAITCGRSVLAGALIRAIALYLRLCARLSLLCDTTHGYGPYLDHYALLRERCAEIGSAQFRIEKSPTRKKSDCTFMQDFDVEAIQGIGINFYPPEVWQGQKYCWSFPRAGLRLRLGSGQFLIRLDARPTGGWLVRNPKLCIDGELIASENISEADGELRILVGSNRKAGSGDSILSWDCIPFRPAKSGLPDQRHLGVALIGMQIRSVDSDATKEESLRAA